MSRLVQCLTPIILFVVIWGLLMSRKVISLPPSYEEVIFYLPIYLLIVFGCYTLFTIGYRVSSFNDCNESAISLKKEIERE